MSTTTLSRDGAAALERMRRVTPKADPQALLPDVSPERIPRHIAIIMDGNGRWANERGLPRAAGHKAGAETVKRVVEACGALGVECLTLYSFSLENWRRPKEEIDALMALCVHYCTAERDALVREGIRLRVIGEREGLPPEVVGALQQLEAATAGSPGPTLALAINYGGRAEIARAARRIAEEVRAGTLDPADVDESAIARRLFTSGMPDPDLLIRTAGEMRVSNFLLWQISYAELHVTRTLWPDFGVADLHAAIRDYACRQRKFGGLPDAALTDAKPPC